MPQKTKKTRSHRSPLLDDTYEVLSCKSKKCYETYWQAKFVADAQMAFNRGLKLKIYKCEFCDGWHLASSS